jgi:hypothetical protein
MGCRLVEGPTMGGGRSDWRKELGRFLKPFLDRLGHKARRQMCPVYVSGSLASTKSRSAPTAETLRKTFLAVVERLTAVAPVLRGERIGEL